MFVWNRLDRTPPLGRLSFPWRWLRFRLRTLLIGITLLGFVFGWFSAELLRAERQRIVVRDLTGNGLFVSYDYQFESDSFDFARQFFGPDFLARVVRIQSQDRTLSVNSFDGLESLTDLREVRLARTHISDSVLERFSALRDLEVLHLSDNELSDDGLVHIVPLTRLMDLDLSHNSRISSDGLKHLRNCARLERLDLRYTSVDLRGLSHLGGLTNIKELRYFGTINADDEHTHLSALRALKQLRFLEIGSRLNEYHLQQIGDLQGILTLKLHDTKVSDTGINALSRLTSLRAVSLWLSGTDTALATMSEMRSLTHIEVNVSRANITDTAELGLRGALPKATISIGRN